MNRRRGAAGFLSGFQAGYDLTGQFLLDRDLKKVANEKPAQMNVPTAEGMTGTLDEQDMPVKQKTVFGGKDYDTLTPEMERSQRTQAMADVYTKHGKPKDALQLMRDEAMTESAQGQVRKQKRDEAKESKIFDAENEVSNLFRNRIKTNEAGMPMPLNDMDMVDYQKALVHSYMKQGLNNEAVKASKEALTYAALLAERNKVERETDANSALSAMAMGDYELLKQFHSKHVADGQNVTAVIPNKDGTLTLQRESTIDGSQLSPFTGTADQIASGVLQVIKPDSYVNYIKRTFDNDIELRKDKRAEEASRRAAASEGRTASKYFQDNAQDAQIKQARYDAWLEQNPNATEAQKRLARLEGGLKGKGAESKYDVKTDNLGGTTISRQSGDRLDIWKADPRTNKLISEEPLTIGGSAPIQPAPNQSRPGQSGEQMPIKIDESIYDKSKTRKTADGGIYLFDKKTQRYVKAN